MHSTFNLRGYADRKKDIRAVEEAILPLIREAVTLCPTLSEISSIVHRELTFRLFTGSKARHASEAT